jgi:uncharacterized membrane protein YhaH (DUF805 family)
MQTIRTLLFSFWGRIPRRVFLVGILMLGAVFLLLFLLLEKVAGHRWTLLLYPPMYWALAAFLVKRLHDRGKAPFWLLLLFVPLFGPLWLGLELCCLRGMPGENRYGADPLQPRADYQVVA